MNNSISFEISRSYAAPVSKLYSALLNPEVLKTLWGLNGMTVTEDPSREAYAEMSFGEDNWNFRMVYGDMIENELLTWKVIFDRTPDKEVHVRVEFRQTGEGTEVIAGQSNFDTEEERDANQNAWTQSLDNLASLIG